MSLFKILRGDSTKISLDTTPFHDGYAYFTPDNGKFYIDAVVNGENKRIPLNGVDTATVEEILAQAKESGLFDGEDGVDGADGKTVYPVINENEDGSRTLTWETYNPNQSNDFLVIPSDITLPAETETDPTVPDWAKASTKPSYTASEVGADASGTAEKLITTHDSSATAHSDIRTAVSTAQSKADSAYTLADSKQSKITGTAGDFVVIGADGNVTTKTIDNAEEVSF